MKQYMILHYGFERPTADIMAAWQEWSESIADRLVDQGGFSCGKEISRAGAKDLAWNGESITGYNIIRAESLDEAERIAGTNPYITGVRVYEIRPARR